MGDKIRPEQMEVTTGTSNNDTVPTLGKVEDMVATVDTWNEVMHLGNTFTVLNTENLSATITQNDTTNNPAALIIANTGSGNDITLPNSSYIKNGLMTLGGLTTVNGIVQTNDPGGSGLLSSSVTLPDGILATTQSPLDNSTKLATTAYVDAAVAVENFWDTGTAGTHDYLKPHTTGDNLHLNDEESTLFTNSDLQIFRNGVATASVWSASPTAGIDSNLNLIRSRGTIGTPLAVADNDLIANINMIGYDGGAFRNGAEIRAEINGAVSSGVLPCDMVFYVNAGAGVATEGMRLLKTKDLIVAGDIVSATNLDIASNSGTGFTRILDENGNPVFTYDNANDLFAFLDPVTIDSHWKFDANALTSLTDNNTTITAYAGKNVTIEGVTFDGGVVAGVTSLTINGVQNIKRTASAGDYHPSALTTDYLIAITNTDAPRAVIISTEDIQSGSTANPRIFVVKDESGGAGANNITVSGESGKIDGDAYVTIAQNHASLSIYADGTNLFIY